VQGASEEVNGHPNVTLLHPPDGGYGRTHALGQRRLRDMASPPGKGNIAAQLADGSLDGKRNREFHRKRSQWISKLDLTALWE
jgi:hypothetical protein